MCYTLVVATEQSGIGDPQATTPHIGRRLLNRVRQFVSFGRKGASTEIHPTSHDGQTLEVPEIPKITAEEIMVRSLDLLERLLTEGGIILNTGSMQFGDPVDVLLDRARTLRTFADTRLNLEVLATRVPYDHIRRLKIGELEQDYGIKVALEEDAGAKYATLVSPYAIDHMGYNQHGFFVRNDPRPGNEKGGVSYLNESLFYPFGAFVARSYKTAGATPLPQNEAEKMLSRRLEGLIQQRG